MNPVAWIERLGWAGAGGFVLLVLILGVTRVRSIHPGSKVWLCRIVFLRLALGALITFAVTLGSVRWPVPSQGQTQQELGAFLFAMWLLGALIVMRHHFKGLRDARALRTMPTSPPFGEIEEDARRFKVSVEVRQAVGLHEPCVVGAFRPCLVVPTAWRYHGTVISHELTHIKHRDLLWNSMMALIFAFFWFVPGLGHLMKETALWQEAWADLIARERGAVEPSAQAEYLLNAIQDVSSPTWAKVGFSGDAGYVARRITAMYQRRHSKVIAAAAFLLAGVVAMPIRLEGTSQPRFLAASPGNQSLTQGIYIATRSD